MIGYIVRFFQRYAHFFATLAGGIIYRRALPDDSPWWLELPVFLAIAGSVYWLLYKEGVTGTREDGKPGLTKLAIAGYSVSYWMLIAVLLFIFTPGDCVSAADGHAFTQCVAGQTPFLIISMWVAAIVYALGLWAEIRSRRRALE
jgi:hypothetical protein